MKKISTILFALSLGFFFLKAEAKTNLVISPQTPQPGDAVFVILDNNQTITTSSFDGKPAFPFEFKGKSRLVFAVPLGQKPGSYDLKIVFENGQTAEHKVKIAKRSFAKVVLGIPEKLDLTPKALGEKLAAEKKNLQSTFASSSPQPYFSSGFGLPLFNNKRMGSPFGEIRQTGDSVIRHLGIDFTAPEGKPVAAINDGKVVKAYNDTVYGNSVIVDHGAHLLSMYLHLSKMTVKEGDMIKKGHVVGALGQTGYATGPHLHLTIKVGDVSVDPLHFVRYFR